jgi:hypothetical protein
MIDPVTLAITGGIGLVGGILNANSEQNAINKQTDALKAISEKEELKANKAYEQGVNFARSNYNQGLSQLDKLYNATSGVFGGQIAMARKQADLAAARSGLVGGSQAQNLLNPSITAATIEAKQAERQAQLSLLEEFGRNMQNLSMSRMGNATQLESGSRSSLAQTGMHYTDPISQGLGGAMSGIGTGLQMNYLLNRS